MLVHAYFDAVLHASVKDKLSILAGQFASSEILVSWVMRGSKDHQKGLDDVVAMHVHSEFDHFAIESGDHLNKGIVGQHATSAEHVRSYLVNQSLYSSGSVDIEGDVHKSWQNLCHHSLKNLRVCCFDYLLAEIVTELIGHDISEDWHHAMHETGVEGPINLLCGTSFICSV